MQFHGVNAQHVMTEEEEALEKQMEQETLRMLQQQKQEKITGFEGYFNFLKNEHPCKVWYEGEFYNSVAHAYEAAKCENAEERLRIRRAPSHKEMLQVAKGVKEPANWLVKKLPIMEKLLRDKFRRDGELRERLVQTGTRDLINLLQSDARYGGSDAQSTAEKLFWG